MASSIPRKRSKKTNKKQENEKNCFFLSYLYKLLTKISVVFLLIILVFIWSFLTTFFSGSLVHVCVTSRKLNDLYCLSAGSQLPAINNTSPSNSKLNLNFIKKVSNFSGFGYLQSLVTAFNTKESNLGVAETLAVPSPVTELHTIRNISENSLVLEKNATDVLASSFSLRSKRVNDSPKEKIFVNARKDVEGHLSGLRSYISKSKTSDCNGRGIYVYDLPEKFNKGLVAKCNELSTWMDYCKYLTNDAMGEPIPELGNVWYNTHQYSLEPIFHSRVLNHPCRVQNMEDAKLFYVPFYGGLDILRFHFKNVSNEVKDTLSNELVEWLMVQNSWKRNSGLDHVIVLGKISWDFRRSGSGTWGTRLLDRPELQTSMKLLIERHAWQINEVGVPHPTCFHPSSDQDILALQAKLRGMNRIKLISFAGAPRKSPDSIRSMLIDQCTSNPENCNFFDCSKNRACLSPIPVMNLFMESEFCLQPPGDSPTRKSVFDSLVAGCIPVVFDPFTAHYQYPWHLPEDHTKYSVYIAKEDVRSSEVNVVDMLLKIPFKERQEMRRYIIDELMPRLVYSDPKAKLENFDDAFSISVNNLLERAAVSRLT